MRPARNGTRSAVTEYSGFKSDVGFGARIVSGRKRSDVLSQIFIVATIAKTWGPRKGADLFQLLCNVI